MRGTSALASVLGRPGGCPVQAGVPLGPLTTLGVGGPASALATPGDRAELTALLEAAAGLPLLVLGGGSNVLVADAGWDGLVVRLGGGFTGVDVRGTRLVLGAGASLSAALVAAERAGLSGLEELCGIPGTLGGAVAGNAGAWGRQIGELVASVEALEPGGSFVRLGPGEIQFGYRWSSLAGAGLVLTRVELELAPGDRERIARRRAELQAERARRQPLGERTAGSFFRNPPGDSAGRLIEEAGCKGAREGAAVVSGRHANFIVNEGGATAAQVVRLASRVRRAVLERFGVALEPEVVLAGARWPWEEPGS